MPKTIITVKNLRKDFRVKTKKPGFWPGVKSIFHSSYKSTKAIDNISFNVSSGEILGFIGPNGAGKSTTIKILTGIMFPTSGDIDVLGYNPSIERQDLAYHIGSIFGQKPQLWYHLPPIDTYNLLSKIYEIDSATYKKRLDFLVGTFDIGGLLNTPVRKMSLGQRMKCEIVATFLHKPKIILLDEPTIGLDVIAKERIRDIIKYLNKNEGVTVFLTSHDAGDIERLAQRTIVINHGKIIFDNSTKRLKKEFIKNKVIEIVTNKKIKSFSFPNSEIIEKSDHSIKIELDTAKEKIKGLVNKAMKELSIKDINIFDPPMEEIIAAIYQDKEKR